MKNLLFILVFMVSYFPLTGQTPADTTKWIIETVDENEFIGTILSEDTESLVLLTEKYGEITIPRADIKAKNPSAEAQVVDGEYWFDSPHSTRYFWGPNGYGLRKGEGYYQNTWILFNQVSIGLSDNITMGVGIIPAFLFGAEAAPVWITPKLSFPVVEDRVNVGGGVLMMTVLGETDQVVGIAYGTGTYGSINSNITGGIGYGVINGEWAKNPTIMVSGINRVNKKWYVLSENYLIPIEGEWVVLISGGARWTGKKMAVDFGAILPVIKDLDIFLVVPWLSINIPFGGN